MNEPLLIQRCNSLQDTAVDVLILPILQNAALSAPLVAIDAALDGIVSDMRARGEFRGELHKVTSFPTFGRLLAARVLLVGLGKPEDCTLMAYRQALTTAVCVANKLGFRTASTDVTDLPFSPEEASLAAAEGAELGRYRADLYRTGERREDTLREFHIAGGVEAALQEGAIRGRAKNLARTLTHEPSNVLDPPELARRTKALAADAGLQCDVLDEGEMEQLGMSAILTVSRGSETPGRFIILRHEGAEDGPCLALVGKAVMFDTGGISLKPVTDMGKMKGDMAGGAAVIGAMRAIAELKVPLRVIGLVPSVLNMPDGRAWRPGDVVTTMAGKTVETITTDAEGRMLLADALHYARQLGATHLVDIATLTGACVVALGHAASGLYGTDADLMQRVQESGEATGERHWPMPLLPDYREQIRSDIADLKNSGGRFAGSNTAAAFLREFVGDTPWAHLDIAGSATLPQKKPWAPAGPTGVGVGTFITLAQRLAGQTS